MSSSDKVVIVTGAASGIGAAIAVSFAELHAGLCIVDINEQDLLKVSKKCQKVSRNTVLEVIADVRTDDDLEKIVKCVLKKLGNIDVLVNCAAIFKPTNLQDSDIIESFDNIIALNLRGVVAMTRKALPTLIQSKGCIINISSICSTVIASNSLIYSISKAGVTTFTKCAAFELARLGVRVNCISPGAVKTNIMKNAGFSEAEAQTFWDSTADKTPMQKCVEAEEVAAMAVYLASEKAASITGADFVVDAGLKLGTIGATSSAPTRATSTSKNVKFL